VDAGQRRDLLAKLLALVNYKSQKDIDSLLVKISDSGKKQSCGWLIEQIRCIVVNVPSIIGEWMQDQDLGRANRVMHMRK
jgi:hypothetical protein